MKNKFKYNNNIVYSCLYNVVWCPKYRRPVLVEEVEAKLKELLHQIAKEIQVEIIELEVMPDHVHLLCECAPQFGIHRVVKRFKGATSSYLRKQFPHLKSRLPTLWTNSYFISTVGGAPLETIKRYVQNQKEVMGINSCSG
ncbi:MAG: IS200/IS605 family transposase [Moorea sp. SIOASIH]|uniref:IS200/IS605 family transposase n=1 Tax=Moorena sp. SIOASIH TaxID=2607817 RepID=UPI0013BA4412|nr:IS200/IS605 family transposase [Moorena sp. SIOASIH]NEO38462.1 IS200/IS605 family transposase [Moorena sp. SIOASIH]